MPSSIIGSGFGLPEGTGWPKRGRKHGQRDPNTAAKDAAIARGKLLVAGGMAVAKAAEAIEDEYYGGHATNVQWPERRLKYLAALLK